jgi:hypothetical protein
MFRTVDANGKVKYAGRSRATVLDNRDPLNKGRIIVDHPLLGSTVWIDYLQVPGQFNVPPINSIVYIEADAGYAEYPIAFGNLNMDSTDGEPTTPTQFIRDIPTNRGWVTPNGNILELDDGIAKVTDEPDDTQFTTQNRGIRLTTKSGYKIHIYDDPGTQSEQILLEDSVGDYISIRANTKEIWIVSQGKAYLYAPSDVLIDSTAATIQMTSAQDTVIKSNNASINLSGQTGVYATSNGDAKFQATGPVLIQGSVVHINGSAGNVLTTATDPVVDTIFGAPTVGVPTVTAG